MIDDMKQLMDLAMFDVGKSSEMAEQQNQTPPHYFLSQKTIAKLFHMCLGKER